jgi:hypothetical protein
VAVAVAVCVAMPSAFVVTGLVEVVVMSLVMMSHRTCFRYRAELLYR